MTGESLAELIERRAQLFEERAVLRATARELDFEIEAIDKQIADTAAGSWVSLNWSSGSLRADTIGEQRNIALNPSNAEHPKAPLNHQEQNQRQ